MRKLILLAIMTLSGLSALAYDARIDGICYNFSGSEATVTYRDNKYNSYSGSVVIPKSVTYNGTTYSVTSIGYCAFKSCSDMSSVTIQNSVTSIGVGAFIGCQGLTAVTIPNSVDSIGGHAFQACSGLTSVIMGNDVTDIGYAAFYNCGSLTSITIPESVTSIGEYAFTACTGLTSITVEKGNTVYDSRDNCNATIETATNTLVVGCQNTFIPNSVTAIGSAFTDCDNLIAITIPSNVKSVGAHALAGCDSLTDVYCLAEEVPETEQNAFENTPIEDATLYVPAVFS